MNKIIGLPVIRTVLSLGILGLSGCTVHLPPNDEPIPSADPILLPGKATTGNDSNSNPTNRPKKKTIKVVPPTSSVNKSQRVIGKSAPLKQGQSFYVVKPKDTVFEVMRQTGVHWKEIIKLNKLKAPSYTIFPGQNLRIK